MLDLIVGALFILIPIALLALFFVSLFRYVSAKRKNKQLPGSFSDAEMTKRLIILIVLSVIVVSLIVIVVGLTALVYMAVAYM